MCGRRDILFLAVRRAANRTFTRTARYIVPAAPGPRHPKAALTLFSPPRPMTLSAQWIGLKTLTLRECRVILRFWSVTLAASYGHTAAGLLGARLFRYVEEVLECTAVSLDSRAVVFVGRRDT